MTIGLILTETSGVEGCDRDQGMLFLAWLLDTLFRLHIKNVMSHFEDRSFTCITL